MKKAAKKGRPATQPRGRLFVRVDEQELASWMAEAEKLGVGLSTWVRMTCNAAAARSRR